MRVKRFTKEGHEAYKRWLEDGKIVPPSSINTTILNTSTDYVNQDGSPIIVDVMPYPNSLRFAEHLFTKLSTTTEKRRIEVIRILDDPLVADWIVYAYFDHLCKKNEDDTYKIGEIALFHLDLSGRQKIYRHRVAGRIALFREYYAGDAKDSIARLCLTNPMNEFSKPMDVITAQEQIVMNKHLMEVIDEMYFDSTENSPKEGVVHQSYPLNPGTLYRFMGSNSFYDQYHLTHDFRTMEKSEIIDLMKDAYPGEFDKWLDGGDAGDADSDEVATDIDPAVDA
jgi:hypothetical protein